MNSKILELKVQKLSKSNRHRGQKTEARGQSKIFALQLPRRGCRKTDSNPPFDGRMLWFRGYMPPDGRKNFASITPFCRGNAGSFAGTCPRMARVTLLASPSFVGAMLAVSRGHRRLQILNVIAYLTRVFLFRGPLAPPGLLRAIFALVLGFPSTLCHKGVATTLALVATASS